MYDIWQTNKHQQLLWFKFNNIVQTIKINNGLTYFETIKIRNEITNRQLNNWYLIPITNIYKL